MPLVALLVGAAGVALGLGLIRSSGADTRRGRRLAGAPSVPIGELQALAAGDQLPPSPVRVEGRVRCANPLLTADGDRLAALHRDAEVQLPDGRWRVIERLRETRPIDLWERTASVPIDLSEAAEPLITIPQVWEGRASELGEAYRPALDRLAAEAGSPTAASAAAARATTRQLTLADRLIVLAVPARDEGGRLRLTPPPGGYLIAGVELDTAMRLLAGPRRRRMLMGFSLCLVGSVVALVGGIGLLLIAG